MQAGAARMAEVDPNAAVLIAVGFFAAFSVKLGLFPFHFWLPTVYTGARPAVAAILSRGLGDILASRAWRFGRARLPQQAAPASPGPVGLGSARIIFGGLGPVSLRTATGVAAHLSA